MAKLYINVICYATFMEGIMKDIALYGFLVTRSAVFYLLDFFSFSLQLDHLPIYTHQPPLLYHMITVNQDDMLSLLLFKVLLLLPHRAMVHIQGKVLSDLFLICDLTDGHDWLVPLQLT